MKANTYEKVTARITAKLKARHVKTVRAEAITEDLKKKKTEVEHAIQVWQWANGCLQELPARLENSLIAEFTRIGKNNIDNAAGWLGRIMLQLNRCKMPFYAINSDSAAEAWAKEQAAKIFTNKKGNYVLISEAIPRYKHVCEYVKKSGFEPVGAERKKLTIEQCQLFCAQMERESWWIKRAKVTAARVREYIAICRGFVGAKADPYCSAETLSDWKKAQEDAKAFLESNFVGLEVETEYGYDDLQVISLADAAASSTADPELRRKEMMTRIRGIKEAATEKLWQADFITWTAPGCYHYNAGPKKWNGYAPNETQKYLRDQWAKARAEIKEKNLLMSGMRVAEPHADATPHWHMLMFSPKEHAAQILAIMEKYATQHFKEELESVKRENKNEPRFKVEHIDPLKGCAVAYVAKYISKSINAAHMENDEDDETGKPVTKDTAASVRAWASRWGIRQFQFFGVPPVTVWRELRRISEPVNCDKTEAIRQAADQGQFKTYLQLMGGLCSSRDMHPVKTMMEVKTASDGQKTTKLTGVTSFEGEPITTRKNWLRLGAAAFIFGRDSAWQGGSRAAWTRENNCKLAPEVINEKLAEAARQKPALVGYLDAAGRWIVEKIANYMNLGGEYEFST